MAEIEEAHKDLMNHVARALDEVFNPDPANKQVCFTLLICNFGEIAGGRVNYLSNGAREDIVSMLHEILARFEGRAVLEDAPSDAKQ
jgi:hypothetical protein